MSSNDTDVPDLITGKGGDLHSALNFPSSRLQRFVTSRVAADLYCLIEMLVVFACGLIVGEYYVRGVLGVADYTETYIWPLLILPLTLAVILQRAGLYSTASLSGFAAHSGKAIAGLFGAFLTLALVGVILGITDDFSRVWYGSWLASSTVALWLARAFAARTFTSWVDAGLLQKRVAIYGFGEPLEKLVQEIDTDAHDLRVIGVFSPETHSHRISGHPNGGDLDELLESMRKDPPDTVLIALPANRLDHTAEAINELSVMPAEIKLYPPFGAGYIPLRGVSSHGMAQFVDLQRKSVSDWGHVAKLVEDYAIASVALVLLSPLLALIALAIKLESRGPVFFTQLRNGLNNRPFRVYKFRTMQVGGTNTVFRQAQRNDPRVTRVGRFLRRTSLDEVPQLFNVLLGEMSIVGPRPHPLELNQSHADKLPLYNKRHSVKPGITGWAQVNDHRGPTTTLDEMRKRLECDLYYVDNWSIWLDLSIIAATPLISVIHKNAV